MENLHYNCPRCPRPVEIEELATWLCDQGHDEDQALSIAQYSYTAVFDSYMSDCPGYAGKVMSVVWTGSPSIFDVFVWEHGKIRREGREYDENECYRCGNRDSTLCFNCWRKHENRQP